MTSTPVQTQRSEKVVKDATLSKKIRVGGRSRTLLLRLLSSSVTESDIEQFVCSKSLSATPLRVELLKFRCSEGEEATETTAVSDDSGCYAFVTFPSTNDCRLVKKHLNRTKLKGQLVVISFSAIPRTDLEGKTRVIEFGTEYPPITAVAKVKQFLRTHLKQKPKKESNTNANQTESSLLSLLTMPKSIRTAPGHGSVKGKWRLTYDSPEMAKAAVERYSGRLFENLFVIMGYQLLPRKTPYDRKECFYGISDRVKLRGLLPPKKNRSHSNRRNSNNSNSNNNNNDYDDENYNGYNGDNADGDGEEADDISLFLQSNSFASQDILDIYVIHQMTQIAQQKYNARKSPKNKKQFKPRKGYCIVTFSSYELATKAFIELNGKEMRVDADAIEEEDVDVDVDVRATTTIRTGFESPFMRDSLKRSLSGSTNVVHLLNLPWDTTNEQLKTWLESAGSMYCEENEIEIEENDEIYENYENEDNVGAEAEAEAEVEAEDVEEDIDVVNPFCAVGKQPIKSDMKPLHAHHTRPLSVYIKYRDGFSTGRANATFVTAEQATMVVQYLNQTLLKDRKISVNYALPIKQFQWRQKRNDALQLQRNERKSCDIFLDDNNNDGNDNDNDDGKDEVEEVEEAEDNEAEERNNDSIQTFMQQRQQTKKRTMISSSKSKQKSKPKTKKFKVSL